MEKILVAIDGRCGAWAALSHACSLAKRMDVDLNVLLVNPPGVGKKQDSPGKPELAVRMRLDLLLETAKAEGLVINYFVTEGPYEDEVILFANTHKIALLVYEACGGCGRGAARQSIALQALRHRLRCRVEVVAPIGGTS
ncbi:MAG: universal stress protein [Desulfopila sp.]